jgi:hypothetical protein
MLIGIFLHIPAETETTGLLRELQTQMFHVENSCQRKRYTGILRHRKSR